MRNHPRFVVLQPGARLHYAVPALLAREGMLERLYTDIHAPGNWGLLGLQRLPAKYLASPVVRLLGRRLPPELRGLVTSAPLRTLLGWLSTSLLHRSPRAAAEAVENTLRSRILHDGFRGATALYTLSNDDLELVREAKARGLFIVHEQIINPHVGRILREERTRYPGLESQDSEDLVEGGIIRDAAQWQLADVILVASRFVAEENPRARDSSGAYRRSPLWNPGVLAGRGSSPHPRTGTFRRYRRPS